MFFEFLRFLWFLPLLKKSGLWVFLVHRTVVSVLQSTLVKRCFVSNMVGFFFDLFDFFKFFGFFYLKKNVLKCLEFCLDFFGFLGFLSNLLRLLLKVTKVTIRHQKLSKFFQKSIISSFFCLKGQKSLRQRHSKKYFLYVV